jgi:hypothetical protein
MKLKHYLLGTALLLTLTSVTLADDTRKEYVEGESPYLANEFVFEGFGSASFSRDTIDNISGNRIKNDARLGAGIGMSYFFCRYVGLGTDAYTENFQHAAVDSVSGSVIGRFPIGTSGFAPYVYGGGGHEFDLTDQWFAHFGGGFEYRFSRAFGIFTDARYVLTDKTSNYGLVRLGVRTAF